jgi:K+-dependent Na+/Ca+ exchanger-like protein
MFYLLLSIIVLIISFYLLNEVTDRFFVPSLDQVATKLKLSDDASGATLMAAGSSAPELFIAIIALSTGDNFDIGVGTIVGSALFNLLIIVGAIGMIRTSKIAWQPMARDIIFYLISIALLYWAYSSGSITLFHVIIFLGVYIVYVIAVVLWKHILPHSDKQGPLNEEEEEEDPAWKKYFKIFDIILEKLFAPKRFYGTNFLISVILIAGLSWALVESAVVISYALNIPKYIVGLTILAFGTSVPDMMSSIIVARQGRGGMAVSNALGSNIFDILIGLGLPWMVLIFITNKSIAVDTGEISTHILVLLGSVAGVLLLFLINRWRINRTVGITMILAYLTYLMYVIYSIN